MASIEGHFVSDPEAAQESFHVCSGIYDLTEAWVVVLFVVLQYADKLLKSLKSVPPKATLKGVEATPLTLKPLTATFAGFPWSQVSEPLSPDATLTVIPWAAACSQIALKKALPPAPS